MHSIVIEKFDFFIRFDFLNYFIFFILYKTTEMTHNGFRDRVFDLNRIFLVPEGQREAYSKNCLNFLISSGNPDM